MAENENVKNDTLASEIYKDLKARNRFLEVLVLALILCLLAMSIYHEYCMSDLSKYHEDLWSEFDTVIVDSGDGSGNANYVQGDNAGGIFNGESGDAHPEGWEIQGNQS